MKNNQVTHYYIGMIPNVDKLESFISYCEEYIFSDNAEVCLVSTCILSVLKSINHYLKYIDKDIRGATTIRLSSSDEWQKIMQLILIPFTKKLQDSAIISIQNRRLELVQWFVFSWRDFPKEEFTME